MAKWGKLLPHPPLTKTLKTLAKNNNVSQAKVKLKQKTKPKK